MTQQQHKPQPQPQPHRILAKGINVYRIRLDVAPPAPPAPALLIREPGSDRWRAIPRATERSQAYIIATDFEAAVLAARAIAPIREVILEYSGVDVATGDSGQSHDSHGHGHDIKVR